MISVIMSTYKEKEDVLKKAIESILCQTYSDLEFIVILDNPENQQHIQLIEEYAKKDDRIRFFQNEKNQGLTYSLNKGIGLANGEYIARMDADDISFPDRLERQYHYLTRNHLDLIGGITIMVDENEEVIREIKSIPVKEDVIRKCLQYSQCIAHPTWFGKKEVFTSLNGYRNVPFCEDYDFTLRAALQNVRISNLNEPVLYYRMTKDSISRQNIYRQYLYMTVITNAYRQGKIADIDQAHKWVNAHFDETKSQSFVRSNVIFNRMLKEKTDHQYLSFLADGVRLLFGSREFLDKIFRFIRLSVNS